MRWPPGTHRGAEGPREEQTLAAVVFAGPPDEARDLQVQVVVCH